MEIQKTRERERAGMRYSFTMSAKHTLNEPFQVEEGEHDCNNASERASELLCAALHNKARDHRNL